MVLPGSKSLSNRTLLLSALSEGTTEVLNLLHSDDLANVLYRDPIHFHSKAKTEVFPGLEGLCGGLKGVGLFEDRCHDLNLYD